MAKFLSKVPTVKVGAHTIKIEITPFKEGMDSRTLGYASYSQKRIDMVKEAITDLPQSMVLEILFHEIFHHILWSYPGLTKNSKHEELIVEALGKSVTELLLSNPKLLEVVKNVAKSKS